LASVVVLSDAKTVLAFNALCSGIVEAVRAIQTVRRTLCNQQLSLFEGLLGEVR